MTDQSPCIRHELVTPVQMSSGAFFTIEKNHGHIESDTEHVQQELRSEAISDLLAVLLSP